MKTFLYLLVLCGCLCLVSCRQTPFQIGEAFQYHCDTEMQNNDHFDNDPIQLLPHATIQVTGELEQERTVDFTGLPLREVLAKETRLQQGDTVFVGAYKYLGYSLHDILKDNPLQKKNAEDFRPNVDAYILITNNRGDTACYSWGEVFFPTNRHQILIATAVMHIVPEKSKDQWPLPDSAKVVVVSDLLTERNISNPTRIVVKSYPKKFNTQKGLSPLYAPAFDLYCNSEITQNISKLPETIQPENIHTIFYGKGRGIHSVTPYSGACFKDVLWELTPKTARSLRQGLLIVASEDGYRAAFSYSEVVNRNDGSEVLLQYMPEWKDGGAFRLIHPGDFFSDRAIKGIRSVWYSETTE